MKLIRMTASFGRLDHETLELADGLNILTMPNEGGKSTWCAFLRVMLYGLKTRERDKKGFLADKTHYLPWSGAPMEGELVCEWQGRELRVRRYTGKNGVPLSGFEAVWADTDEEVPGLTADNLGDILIGVGRGVFERSAFLGQADLPLTQSKELEQRLSALVSSGEEDVSPTQVRDQLTEWQRKRQFRNRGSIPTLEERRSRLEMQMDEIRETTEQILEHQTEIDSLHMIEENLTHQIDLYEARKDDEQARAYDSAEEELKKAEEHLEKLRQQMPPDGTLPPKEILEKGRDAVAELRATDNQLKQTKEKVPIAEAALAQAKAAATDEIFSGDAAAARAKTQEAVSRCAELEQEKKRNDRLAWMLPVLGLLLAAGLGCVMYFAISAAPVLCVIVAVVVLAALAVVGVVFLRMARRCDAERKKILDDFHVTLPTELSAVAEDYCTRLEDIRRAEETLTWSKKSADELQERREKMWESLCRLTAPFAPEVTDIYGVTAAIGRALTLLDAVASAERSLESAQKLFDTVAQHGRGSTAATLEEPTYTREKAEAGLQEAGRRMKEHESQKAMALGRQSTIGDVEAVQAEIDSVDRDLARERADLAALDLALAALEDAENELRERFSPRLNRLAGNYFSRLTGGKYEKIHISRALDAAAEETGALAERSVLSLSQGTTDQLWLAIRLAVCDLALPEEDPCPLVLDDALVNFDNERLKPALKLIDELAQRRQILLFTCHDRERTAYDAMKGNRT